MPPPQRSQSKTRTSAACRAAGVSPRRAGVFTHKARHFSTTPSPGVPTAEPTGKPGFEALTEDTPCEGLQSVWSEHWVPQRRARTLGRQKQVLPGGAAAPALVVVVVVVAVSAVRDAYREASAADCCSIRPSRRPPPPGTTACGGVSSRRAAVARGAWGARSARATGLPQVARDVSSHRRYRAHRRRSVGRGARLASDTRRKFLTIWKMMRQARPRLLCVAVR